MKRYIFLFLISFITLCSCEDEPVKDGGERGGAAYLLTDKGDWNLVEKQAMVNMPKNQNEVILTLKSDGFTPELIEIIQKTNSIDLVLMDTIPDEEYYGPFDYNNMRGITQRIKITTDPYNNTAQSISFRVHTHRTYNGWYSDFKVVKK